jgi:RHS repeat-associated protein
LDGETGLYYYRARYYDPTMGRFISEDPLGFGAGDTNLYRYVGNSSTMATDPTGEFANVAAGAGFGALFGGLGALANDIESGQFGWNTFGNVAKGAAAGAAIGFVVASGVGILSGFATAMFGTSVAGAIVNTGFVAAGTAYGAYNAGGNFGSGKYLTGALDLFGVAAGAKNVFSGVTRNIPQMYWAEVLARRANYAAMYPPNPNPPGYQRQVYQVGDPQLNSSGAIIPAGSSALANRTSVGGAIVPYSHPSAGQLVLANSAGSALAQATQFETEYERPSEIFNYEGNPLDFVPGKRQGLANRKMRLEFTREAIKLGVQKDNVIFTTEGESGFTPRLRIVKVNKETATPGTLLDEFSHIFNRAHGKGTYLSDELAKIHVELAGLVKIFGSTSKLGKERNTLYHQLELKNLLSSGYEVPSFIRAIPREEIEYFLNIPTEFNNKIIIPDHRK